MEATVHALHLTAHRREVGHGPKPEEFAEVLVVAVEAAELVAARAVVAVLDDGGRLVEDPPPRPNRPRGPFDVLAEVAPRSSWILLLTSAGAAEGKTTAIVNLAMTHAHTGSRVLLVDADLRRPTLHERIGLYNEVGLTSYLIGCAGVEEVRQPTSIRNLTLVTSGPQAPNPYELLASPRMETFLAEARKSFDVVLIDTPPLLPVSDAVLLSSRVDASILVASATRTRYVEASRSRDLLLSRENAFLGVILNFTHRRPRTDYLEEYYPSYGYRYYRYEREPEEVG